MLNREKVAKYLQELLPQAEPEAIAKLTDNVIYDMGPIIHHLLQQIITEVAMKYRENLPEPVSISRK